MTDTGKSSQSKKSILNRLTRPIHVAIVGSLGVVFLLWALYKTGALPRKAFLECKNRGGTWVRQSRTAGKCVFPYFDSYKDLGPTR